MIFIPTYLSAGRCSSENPTKGSLAPWKRIQALVEWDEGLDGSAGVDARGTDEAGQQLGRHDGAVEEGTEKRHLGTPKEKSRLQNHCRRLTQHFGTKPVWPHCFSH